MTMSAVMMRTASTLPLMVMLAVGSAWALQPSAPEDVATQPPTGDERRADATSPGIDLEPSELFTFANSAYADGDYAAAVRLYQELLQRGVASGVIYYNLGNALLRNGELGPAIAAYLRGRSHRPRDRDLRANLEFARSSILDDLEPPAPPALVRSLLFWHYSLSRWELWKLAGAANVLLFVVLAVGLLRPGWRWTRAVAAAAGLLLVLASTSAAIKSLVPARTAVVTGAEASGFNANSESSPIRFQLHEGAEVAVVEVRDEWVRVRLPGGEEGWLTRERVDLVRSW